MLVCYHDGANPAFACSIYCVWEVEKGESHVATLLAAKARINTGNKVSTPHSEMNSLVILCRLITALLPGLVELPKEVVLIGDSEATISAVETENTLLQPFFTNRVSEVEEHIRGILSAPHGIT